VQATTSQLEQGYFESARGGDYVLVIARQNHRLRSARRNSIDARCNALSVRSGVGHGSRARARTVGLSSSQLNRPRRRRTASLCEPPRRRAWIRSTPHIPSIGSKRLERSIDFLVDIDLQPAIAPTRPSFRRISSIRPVAI
jgi:hypothetical protein